MTGNRHDMDKSSFSWLNKLLTFTVTSGLITSSDIKITDMRKSLIIIIVLAAGFLVAGMLYSPSSVQNAKKPDCKAAFNECCYKKT